MARSSLLGIDPSPAQPAGRDKASLGPGDSSDSGSDVTGLDADDDDADPGLPVDVALRDDQPAPLPLGVSLPASDGGTGVRDGADIGVDRVFSVDGTEVAGELREVVDEAALDTDDADDTGQDEEAGDDRRDGGRPAGSRRRRVTAAGRPPGR